ncbi:hypothetical protein XENOCAPTIV_024808, partial [Xenoophorus captivus]
TLKGLCLDSKRSSILQRLELSLDILGGTVERISSTAEVLGAVHQLNSSRYSINPRCFPGNQTQIHKEILLQTFLLPAQGAHQQRKRFLQIRRAKSTAVYGSLCKQDPLAIRLHRCRWARICTNLFVLFCVVMLTYVMWKLHEGEPEP